MLCQNCGKNEATTHLKRIINGETEKLVAEARTHVKKGEKKNLLGRWKVDNFLHCKSVIRLDYSEELYTEIVSLYPRRVIDYCKK